jgi:fumarate hydratase class I
MRPTGRSAPVCTGGSSVALPSVPEFHHVDVLPLGPDDTEYRRLDLGGVTPLHLDGRDFLRIELATLTGLVKVAMTDIQHLLRPSHLARLRAIIDDPEASPNDRFVATDLLRNACVSAGGVLPMCQDTGTAIVIGKRTEGVFTGGGADNTTGGRADTAGGRAGNTATDSDEAAISRGVFEAYQDLNLRYSQMAPVTFWEERNTGTNLPAQVELYHAPGAIPTYEFLILAKGGGSANKTFLYQETKALLNPTRLARFLEEKLRALGTSACPPYHLAVVVGGMSAEYTLKVAKLASARYLDTLPERGSGLGEGFRDRDLEAQVLELTRRFGIGAQFGGKYFCHDVRVIRLPRHGASLPVAVAVSCSADRQAKAKITADGVFLERLERDPARFLPDVPEERLDSTDVVRVDLNQPMSRIRAQLSTLPVRTRVALTGPMVVARDIAHAKIAERLDAGERMPAYLRDHPVYYAGPAKTPAGYASGSFGPTTAGRMDSYVERFQAAGGSLVMLAKGNRSRQVSESCRTHGGFYLGSIGGQAALLAQDCIRKVEVLEYPELGMEAVWKIEVEDFPAFVVIDDKGNDFFAETSQPLLQVSFR